MTRQLNILIYLLLPLSVLISCIQSKTNKIAKDKSIYQDSCACVPDILGPPPPPNSVISTDTIFYKSDNKTKPFILKLIADKTIDIDGKQLELFQIIANTGFKSETYDFALPTQYNRYWSQFHIYKDTQKNIFSIGFENTDSNFVHKFYSVYLDTLPFNKGLIRFDYAPQILKSHRNTL